MLCTAVLLEESREPGNVGYMPKIAATTKSRIGERLEFDQFGTGCELGLFDFKSFDQGTMYHMPFHQMFGNIYHEGGVHPMSLGVEFG